MRGNSWQIIAKSFNSSHALARGLRYIHYRQPNHNYNKYSFGSSSSQYCFGNFRLLNHLLNDSGQPFGTLADDQKINAFKAARPFDLKLKRPASTTKKIEAARQEPTLAGGGVANTNGASDGKPIANQNNKLSGDKKDERGFFAKLFTCCSTQPNQPSTEHDINYR